MPNLTPEQRARETIDAMLAASGWSVQAKDAVNLSAALGVAVCELSFATGAPDYTLFVDCKAIGTVEAKPEGVTLTSVEEQSAKYVAGVPSDLPACFDGVHLMQCHASTGDSSCWANWCVLVCYETSIRFARRWLEIFPNHVNPSLINT